MKDALGNIDRLMSGIYKDYKKFFKYMGVGIIGTIADWIAFYILIGFADFYYIFALALSYAFGTVINFFLNKRFTFDNKYKKIHFQFLSFAFVALIGLVLNEALLYAFVHYVFTSSSDMALMVSRVIVTFIVFVWNFVANKQTTFKIFQ